MSATAHPSAIAPLAERLRRWFASTESRLLLLLLGVGAALRLALTYQWRPAFLNYPDVGIYLLDSRDPFFDPLRVAGYGMFIRGVAEVIPRLEALVVVQHGMGLASAALAYAAVRLAEIGAASRWVALVPAATIALGGSQIRFEHTVLTESSWLFLFLLALVAMLWSARLPTRRRRHALLLTAGALLGASVTFRLAGLPLVPVLLAWELTRTDSPRLRRLPSRAAWLRTGLLAAGVAATLLAFAAWHQAETGRFGLTRNGVMNWYGRVAPWADCTKFTPPAGTDYLCDAKPVREREGHEWYVFAASPAAQRWGVDDYRVVLDPQGAREIGAWSRAAALGQPGTYVRAVATEMRRLVDPHANPGIDGQPTGWFGRAPDDYGANLEGDPKKLTIMSLIAEAYPASASNVRRGNVAWLDRYERLTTPHPIVMGAALLLCCLAPLVARARTRRAASLFAAITLVMLVVPVLTSMYDYRYVIPALPFLAAAAAFAVDGLAARLRARTAPTGPALDPT